MLAGEMYGVPYDLLAAFLGVRADRRGGFGSALGNFTIANRLVDNDPYVVTVT